MPSMEKSEKSWKSEKSNQNIVMNEEFVKNSVMSAKIDLTVLMELSTFIIGGWNNLQPSNQRSMKKDVDENEPWLSVGIQKQRCIPCDTIHGKTLCEFGSTHEEIDVTS